MKKSREKISCALWRQISKVLAAYVHQTDIKRFHLAELRKLDSEGAIAIAKNQQQIAHEEEQVEKLRSEYSALVEAREDHIKHLENTVKSTTGRFFQMRKNLCFEIGLDEKQLTFLTNESNHAINHLRKISSKGDQIVQMVQTCRKFETDEEKVNRWASFISDDDILEEESADNKSSVESGDSQTIKAKPKAESKFEAEKLYKPKFSLEEFSKTLDETSDDNVPESSTSSANSSFNKNISEDSLQPSSSAEDSTETSEMDTELAVRGSKTGIAVSISRPTTSVAKPSESKQSLRKFKSEETFKRSQEKPLFQISTCVVKATTSEEKPMEVARKSLSRRPTKSAIISQKRLSASVPRKPSKLQTNAIPKSIQYSLPTPPESPSDSSLKSFPTEGFKGLEDLEGLWWIFNKVEMDCISIRKEKKRLVQENSKLKEMTRDVLAAAALGQSIPSAKSSRASVSRNRFILSAPLSTF